MRKQQNKLTIKVILISYLALILGFIWGYLTYRCRSFICFGPVLNGIITDIILLPVIVIIGSIYLISNKEKISLYLKSTMGVAIILIALSIASFFAYRSIKSAIADHKNAERIKENNEYINNTIASDIKEVYPNADINIPFWSSDTTYVDLYNYTYETQPDMDEELNKWINLSQKESLKNYPYEIEVRYHFGNEYNPFVGIKLKDFQIFYSEFGLSKEVAETINDKVKNYLLNYYPIHVFSVYDSCYGVSCHYEIWVDINRKVDDNNKSKVEEIWNNFTSTTDINMKIVDITVKYTNPNDSSDIIYYHYNSEKNEWYQS